MSVPTARTRKTSENDDTDKTKHGSGHAGTKNGTHGKTDTPEHTKSLKKAKSVDHSNVSSKSDAKKLTFANTREKSVNAAKGAHTNETTKSHGAHSNTKAPVHTETQGKTAAHGRSDTHGKTGTTVKKSDVHKSRTTKNNKSDQDKEDHTEGDNAVTTAVSHDSESKKSDDDK